MKLFGVTGLHMSASIPWVCFSRIEVKIKKAYGYQNILKTALIIIQVITLLLAIKVCSLLNSLQSGLHTKKSAFQVHQQPLQWQIQRLLTLLDFFWEKGNIFLAYEREATTNRALLTYLQRQPSS